jgi:phenylacetate-CoA ligase
MAKKPPVLIPVLPVLRNLVVARRRERLAPDRMREVQARLLRRLVRHAHANVPYYREVLDPAAVAAVSTPEELAALPLLDRATLTARPVTDFLAEGSGPTKAAVTSGSTGNPAELHYSEHDLGYLRATYLHDLLACGMRPWDRIGYVRRVGFRHHPLERLGLARNVHISPGVPLDDQVAAFLRGRPTFLRGFPNAILSIVEELERRGIEYPAVHTVVFGGERVTPEARDHIARYFGAKTHEVYGAVEAYTIARSCPAGALHLRSADVVVEVRHDDGSVSVADGEGEILVTRLHAEAMPLIRYRLGDRVSIGRNDCPCGVFHTPVVREVQGRVTDRVVAADGRSIHALALVALTEWLPGIRRIQLQQREPGTAEMLVEPAPDAPADLAERIGGILRDKQVGLTVSVRLVDAIPPDPTGKLRVVKQLGELR